MNFSEFLRQWRTQKKIGTAKDHFEELGGEKILGILLRQFQLIESDRQQPSPKVFAAIFKKVPVKERKAAILAYLESTFFGLQEGKALIEHVDQYLAPAVETESKSIWDTKQIMMYSDEQLDFLNKNQDALRLHKKVLLFDEWPKRQSEIPADKLKMMVKLALVRVEGNKIFPSRNAYRLPHFDNSSPRSVAKASTYIRNHMDLFLSNEGSTQQELGYAFQLVSPRVAQTILEQMKSFKRWVQALSDTRTDEDLVPLVFVGFAKQLDRKEL